MWTFESPNWSSSFPDKRILSTVYFPTPNKYGIVSLPERACAPNKCGIILTYVCADAFMFIHDLLFDVADMKRGVGIRQCHQELHGSICAPASSR